MRDVQPPTLDPAARALIDAAEGGHEPNELNRARVRRGVDLRLAAGIGLTLGPVSSVLAGAAAKVTLAVAAVGVAVGAGAYVIPHVAHTGARPPMKVVARPYLPTPPTPPAPPPVEALAPAPAVIVPPAAAAAPMIAPAPRRRLRMAAPATPVENGSALAQETALLASANSALARHDVTGALARLDEYDHRASAGILAEERTVTGVLALCAAGQREAAGVEARRFRMRWPRSPLVARIDGSCVPSP